MFCVHVFVHFISLSVQGFNIDTNVNCNLLSVDGVNDPEVLSINATSAAIALSDVPWGPTVGAVRLGLVAGEVLVNPTRRQLAHRWGSKENFLKSIIPIKRSYIILLIHVFINKFTENACAKTKRTWQF